MTMDEDHMVLAAEWVLGTLDADELAKAEALIGSDPEFAAMVRDWEGRLGELNVMVAPVEPPPELLEKVKARIAGAPQDPAIHLPDPHSPARLAELRPVRRGSDELRVVPPRENAGPQYAEQRARVLQLNRKVRRWQEFGAALATLAAAIAAVFVTSLVRPDLMPEKLRPRPRIVEVVKTVELQPEKLPDRSNRFTAVLQRDAASPAFILTVDLSDRTMTVRRVAADNPVGKSYELWLVSNKYPAPRSLGVVQPGEFSRPAQLASYDPETIRDATFAVSLEPEGGSPTGTATGPVLWAGKLIEALPEK
jgi:anti-sigma-K factor RskA